MLQVASDDADRMNEEVKVEISREDHPHTTSEDISSSHDLKLQYNIDAGTSVNSNIEFS